MTYWHDVFTLRSWAEFEEAGSRTSGFPDRRWRSVQEIALGDILLCYMTGKSCWFAALEVMGKPYQDYETRIWSDDMYPSRVGVKPLIVLRPENGITAAQMLQRLCIFEKVRTSSAWGLVLRGAPRKLPEADGHTILTELRRLSSGGEEVKPPPEAQGARDAIERRHEELKRKIRDIGETLGRHVTLEYHASPYIYDVVWKDTEGLPRPSHVFEVQDKGSVDLALAKLQHARDMWRPRLFLIVTGESDRTKVELLLRPYLQGTFHGISRDTRVLTGGVVDELHGPFTAHREAIVEFVER